jgi:hypothetical protein
VIYVLALIGAVTVSVLLWKAFGPNDPRPRKPTVLAPDDDPDFLRQLGERGNNDPRAD